MAPRVPDRAKPTVYLDQSTICDAFQAHLQPSRHHVYRPLLPWIERVAHEANLCLSTAHIAEVSRWSDHATANALADWIDGLPTVWIRSMSDLGDEEDEYWTKVAAGLNPSVDVEPFTSSLIAAFSEITADASTEALRRPGSIHPFLDIARAHGFRGLEAWMSETIHEVLVDREWAREQRWSDDRKDEEIAHKRRVDLRIRAEEARMRINMRSDADLKGRQLDAAVQDALVNLVERDSLAMPTWRTTGAFSARFAEVASGLRPPSSKERELVSSFFDYQHLAVAAAHCDVFTCDRMVREAISPTREKLGRSTTLAAGKHPGGLAGFVADLMSTWP